MAAALTFERVTKEYRGGRRYVYGSLRDDVAGLVGRLAGAKREPRSRIRALDDLSFEIPEGESFGLIGPNGAGKTTALKIATRVTYPTTGRMRVRGRVGALLEVGTGMHPELTGRENVHLYGRILGLRRGEIERRFDEIVEFSGLSASIDQPVKQYSSGMQLRLGFSVAAHIEPDVLLVDEAIAVGDAGFQHRCVERMADLIRAGGTLVFVSHDTTLIETLCTRAVLLAKGRIVHDGPARETVAHYLHSVEQERLVRASRTPAQADDKLKIEHVELIDAAGHEVDTVASGEPLTVRIHFRTRRPVSRPSFEVVISDGRREGLASASMLRDGQSPASISGHGYVECAFAALPLQPRAYEIWCEVRGEHGYGIVFRRQRLRLFRVVADLEPGRAALTSSLTQAPVRIPYRWDVVSQEEEDDASAAGGGSTS
jgi:ABC-type polysaccharide/polyol phosphate transport system ATPase subunit